MVSTLTKPRLKNVALTASAAVQALQAFTAAVDDFGLPRQVVDLVHLRASQINGCSVCTDLHSREAKKHGERDERLNTLAAWRDTPYFSDAERAALALTEAATRMSDRSEAVPDEIWNEAARYYDERALTALVVQIAAINAWNRLNALTRQPAGEWLDRLAN